MSFGKVQDHGGPRETFGLGAERERKPGKGRFDLIPPIALMRLAQHYENGAVKYSQRNWEKGLPLSQFIDSGFRHLSQFMSGDRTEDHLAAVLWNISGYLWTEDRIAKGKLPAELEDAPWPRSTEPELKSPSESPPEAAKRKR